METIKVAHRGEVVDADRMSDGARLESTITTDIEAMPGVLGVTVKRDNRHFEVAVTMDDRDFERFRAVIRKEVDLYDRYSGYSFNFDVTPVAAMEAAQPALPDHAA